MRRSKRTVLLALTDAHHGFFRGAARYAHEHHWHLVADMIYTARVPIGWRGDGIISFIGYREDLAQFVMAAPVPKVEISMVRNDLNIPRVEGDSEMIGRLAAEHFLERGFRRFVWAPMIDDVVNAERYRGFANTLAKEDFTCDLLPPALSREEEPGSQDWAAHRRLLVSELRRLPKPVAVFGYNDCVAADIIDACEEAGLLVPESVAVMGVDNDTMLCECLSVPLSSVCHDLEGMAYQAAALLDRLMDGDKPPSKVLRIPPKGLVTRRSTDVLAAENPRVAHALRHIRDHFGDHLLSVTDIVSAAKVSRRTLEKAFQAELKRSINEEVVRVRVERVKEMLAGTGLPVSQIAADCGFSRPNHLYRTFRRLLRTSPRAYRRNQLRRAHSRSAGLAGRSL